MRMHHRLAVLAAALAAAPLAAQQQPSLPLPSPHASVSQTFGVTEVTLRYSRPGVKGRAIWGQLVPYGQVWRTGANENTTISWNTPVRIGGKELPAGTYGLQTIPTAGEWTVIFSKDADQWGAFSYKQENDALRIQVKPQPAEPEERMAFEIENVTDSSAEVVLRWERLKVPFRIEADTPQLVVAAARGGLRWQTQAAAYCVQAGSCLDDAARWLDASIAVEPGFGNQRTKALLLARREDWKGAVTYGEKALAAAHAQQQPPPGNQLQELETQIAQWKKK
ncbi:MAG: DUF2911 domain-containing protein [Acidobacteriota bacterium]|nr:DUF2911 domain-containing protein [Acidobacteriota bacterium]